MQELKPLWITWERQVRNKSLSSRMGAQLVEVIVEGNLLKRYLFSLFITFKKLFQWRRQVVFVQNPSLVLSLFAVLLRPLFAYKLIVDAHNAGVYQERKFLQCVVNFIIRFADYVIITNEALAARITELGGHPLILPDPLPDVQAYLNRGEARASKSALFICSWAADEPYYEVFAAAEKLPDITFYVTGKSKGKEKGYHAPLPANVVLTGYLPHEQYHDLLNNSDVIIDLTTRENCLVCGAYESVAAEIPFVVSDTKALREYFRSGCVYVANHAAAIAGGVQEVLQHYHTFKSDVSNFKADVEKEWNLMFAVAFDKIMKQ